MMRLSCNDFKITKFVKKNCKIICVGEQFSGPILVGQVLAQKVPHNKFFVEYGLKNSVSVSLNGLLHGLREYTNKNENATM